MSDYRQSRLSHRFISRLLALPVVTIALSVASGHAEVLLFDNFDGTPGSTIDSTKWKVPPGGDGASYGLTTVKTALPDLATVESDVAASDGKAAVLRLDTFLPGNTGAATDRVFGAEFVGRSSYVVGGGLVFESRVRFGSGIDTGSAGTPGVIAAPPSGFVGGVFLYDLSNAFNDAADPLVRDETDFELLSKQTDSILTNTYNDDGFPGVGGNPFLDANPVVGFSPYMYHDYKMTITPTGVAGETETQWFVDNTLIRTVTGSSSPNYSANDGMTPHFNLWMPDSGFALAHDGNLSAGSPGANETYTMSIDSMSVTRINTAKGLNQVANGSFSEDGFTTAPGAPITGWDTVFANASVSAEIGDSGDGDGFTLKTFDPPSGGFDASGVFQNVPVTAGDEISFSVDVQTPSADAVTGVNTQFAEVWVQFEDAVDGSTIARRTAIPMDAGDPNLTEDAWRTISIEAIVPAGATNANIQLAHITNLPPTQGSGSIYWDNVQLNVLSVTNPVTGDYDDSGQVGQTDLDLVLLNWGDPVPPTPTNPVPWVNQIPTDGQVNQNDLDGVLLNWGNALAAGAISAVPEPSTLLLLGLSVCLATVGPRNLRTGSRIEH